MNLEFIHLSLKIYPTQKPEKLINLSKSLDLESISENKDVSQKIQIGFNEFISIDEFIDIILNGNAKDLEYSQWVFGLCNKEHWDLKNPHLKSLSAEKIWQILVSSPCLNPSIHKWLKQSLFRLLLLDYSYSLKIIASSIKESLPNFINDFSNNDKSLIILVEGVRQQNYQAITRLASELNLTPRDLFDNLQLPSDIPATKKALEYVIEFFLKNRNEQWLLRCFSEMSTEQLNKAVNDLLTSISAQVGSSYSQLVVWLNKNYGPRSSHSKWNYLSSPAQLALRQWIGAASWEDFRNLVESLVKQLEQQLHKSYPEESNYGRLRSQINQLKRRKDFWSNYSDSFERLRILVPKKTESWLRHDLKRDIDILTPDGSEATEICIFDFGELFIVEFFRGEGSEMRLFNRLQNPKIEQTLFSSPQLSVKKLRCLGGIVHDHGYLWQVFAEKLLTQNRIYPNKGTIYFKGLDYPYNHYKLNTGLPTPSINKQQQRENSMRRWEGKIRRLEQEARSYYSK